ncbi:MAG TPA: D-alanine--D-alanine ligase [Blastocatellia bacterium]|nr:D-alanine--D-alanine ligase [Blastocatellia bacterium]
MERKIRVGVIFGGRSGEHEVSLMSAESVINAMDKSKYDIVPIAITKRGGWLISKDSAALLPQSVIGSTESSEVAIVGDPTRSGLMHLDGKPAAASNEPLDVVFPVLHGTYGEDGTIQGLLEMAGVPYVGNGVLASAAGMDKIVMKRLFAAAGLNVAEYDYFNRSAWEREPDRILDLLIEKLGLPVFCKPANLGSSVGISKANDRNELADAIKDAARYDRRIIVERAVIGKEIEISVLGNDDPIASLPGEIIPGHEFYDYEDKYIDNRSRSVIPADLPSELVETIQQDAITAFRAIDGAGLARVDFFVEQNTNRVIINEINTMPGFTSISMYPKMWAASGIGYAELIDRLIGLAIERHQEKSRNLTSYSPKQ